MVLAGYPSASGATDGWVCAGADQLPTGLPAGLVQARPPRSVAECRTQLADLENWSWATVRGIGHRARAIADIALDHGWTPEVIRAELLACDVDSRDGRSTEVLPTQQRLVERSEPYPVLHRHAVAYLASATNRVGGDREEAMRLVHEALDGWPVDEEPAWRVEAMMVYTLVGITRSGVDYTLIRRMADEVNAVASPLMASVYLANVAEVSADCGDLAVGSEFADAASALLRRHPEIAATLTLDSIARARLAAGELINADWALSRALEIEPVLGCADIQGDPWLTYAEVRLAQGLPDDAMAMLDHPRRFPGVQRAPWLVSRDLRLRSTILAQAGRFEDAYRALAQHVELYETLRSIEGDRMVAETEAHRAVSEERRRADLFERLALTDPLTELPNRRRVDRWLSEAAAHADDLVLSGGGRPTQASVAIIDLDFFKQVNDRYSHDAGDAVLRTVARAIAEQDPDADEAAILTGRLGGEEFVVLWAGLTDDDVARHAEDILDRIRGLRFTEIDASLRISASIGLATGIPAAGGANLMRAADQALYRAKANGRDRLVSTILADGACP